MMISSKNITTECIRLVDHARQVGYSKHELVWRMGLGAQVCIYQAATDILQFNSLEKPADCVIRWLGILCVIQKAPFPLNRIELHRNVPEIGALDISDSPL